MSVMVMPTISLVLNRKSSPKLSSTPFTQELLSNNKHYIVTQFSNNKSIGPSLGCPGIQLSSDASSITQISTSEIALPRAFEAVLLLCTTKIMASQLYLVWDITYF